MYTHHFEWYNNNDPFYMVYRLFISYKILCTHFGFKNAHLQNVSIRKVPTQSCVNVLMQCAKCMVVVIICLWNLRVSEPSALG